MVRLEPRCCRNINMLSVVGTILFFCNLFSHVYLQNVTCFNDKQGNTVKDAGAKGFNPGLIVLLVVGGLLLVFLIGNYILYMYAQKTLPPKKKKPVSKKKMKKERLKQGVSAPGEQKFQIRFWFFSLNVEHSSSNFFSRFGVKRVVPVLFSVFSILARNLTS